MTAPAASNFPERIGRYELLVPLGSGGMATVYLARSEAANGFARTVALKLLHAHLRIEPDLVGSILEEAKLAALIHHPNVVTVIDAGDHEAGPFMVMDYVEGDSLRALQKRGNIPAPIALRILDDALAGLHAAHELTGESGAALGLIHRDFTPHNILVGVDGMARLLDFGVAKAMNSDSRTRTGAVKGKVRYMPPEQVRGESLDRRCDVWAAGVVAWELLAGRRLFTDGEDDIAVAMKIVQEGAPSLRDVRPDLPAELHDAIASALMPRGDRCPTAAELRRRLARGAESLGGLASHGEVGDFVFKAFGDILQDRTHRANAVRDARAANDVAEPSEPVAEAGNEATLHASSLDTGTTKRRSRAWVGWTALAAAAAIGTAAFAFSGRGGSPAAPPPASSPAVPEPTQLAAAPSAESVASPPNPTPAPVAGGAMMTVSANVPIRSLKIGEREVAFPRPTREAVVELRGEERSATLEIQATAADGRTANVTTSAGSTEAKLSFVVASTRRPPPPPPRPSSSAPPLIKNPYR